MSGARDFLVVVSFDEVTHERINGESFIFWTKHNYRLAKRRGTFNEGLTPPQYSSMNPILFIKKTLNMIEPMRDS